MQTDDNYGRPFFVILVPGIRRRLCLESTLKITEQPEELAA